MNLKYYLPFFMEIFKKQPNLSDAVSDSTSIFRKAMREEIMSVSIRILGAAIVSAVVIYAIINVMSQLNQIMLTQVQGEIISIFTFSLVAIIGGLLLMPILKGSFSDSDTEAEKITAGKKEPPRKFEVSHVVESFYGGLIQGLRERTRHAPEPKFFPKIQTQAQAQIRAHNMANANLTSGGRYAGNL